MTRIKALSENRDLFRQLFVFLGLALAIILYMGCGGSSSTPPPPTPPAAPQVTGTVPTNGTVNVDPGDNVEITFSKPMDRESVEDEFIVFGLTPGHGDTINFTWNSASTVLSAQFIPDLANTQTYTVTIGPDAQDQESPPNKLGTPVTFSFSTGPVLAQGTISGTVVSDPDSTHDNNMSETLVALFASDIFDTTVSENDPLIIVPVINSTGSSADYIFNNLPVGTYYVAAVQNSNGDSEVNLELGDSIGVYQDITQYFSVNRNITAGTPDVTGVDIPLRDPEVIGGTLNYSGAWTGDASSRTVTAYAFTGDSFVGGTLQLDGSNANLEQAYFEPGQATPMWYYWLNPFLDSTISAQSVKTRITPGDYQTIAQIDIPRGSWGSSRGALGFASTKSNIADTGDDDISSSMVVVDTIILSGTINKVIDTSSGTSYYGSAAVSLLNWPLLEAISNGSWGSTTMTGFFSYDGAPLTLEGALHVEPGAADAGTLLATNSKFDVLTTANANSPDDFEIPLVHKNVVAQFASIFNIAINPNMAQVAGFVRDHGPEKDVPGFTVSITNGSNMPSPRYLNSAGNGSASATSCVTGGPQFFFFNVNPADAPDLPFSDTVSVNAVMGGTSLNEYIPLGAGELTILEFDVTGEGLTTCP